jgi:hypothetical protein
LWPGRRLKLIDRTTFYNAINQGSALTWPDDFKRDDPDREAALKKAQDFAQDLKSRFVKCDPNFAKVAKDSYDMASKSIHHAYAHNWHLYVML